MKIGTLNGARNEANTENVYYEVLYTWYGWLCFGSEIPSNQSKEENLIKSKNQCSARFL